MQAASIKPYPKEWEKLRPTAFCDQSLARRLALCAHRTVICWTSLQVNSGLTSKISAMIPAAKGAEAEVPVCVEVQV